jgi:hypothetical protein
MAKDKKVELEYKMEGLKRMFKRKKNRIDNYKKKIEKKKNTCTCRPYYDYCYCGNGTPYSY